ncbi:uncharacterized protein HKW66_Vig0201860 [Vigna angularis]|uniref:NusG-like N-terminal domain-containing protein n=1 Tax=Phaseolus angularis TaxID=3914 RepID=A0A8T0JRT1_PHAAN|nr:uncharacterized protein HKW66_Vig0201860 [Vigna angularis]
MFQRLLNVLSDHCIFPFIVYLRPYGFGCVIYVHLHPHQRTKLEERAMKYEISNISSKRNLNSRRHERIILNPLSFLGVPLSGSWMDELNLDNLAKLGPQWWVIRVLRIRGHEIAQLLARSLALNYPDVEFKIYVPSVNEKRRLKNGSYSVKPRQLFPGCVFLRCVMNKELHDFIREYDGVGGFIGSTVGNTKRQINRPKPLSDEDVDAILRQAKEEQEKTDQAFEEEEKRAALVSGIRNTELEPDNVLNAIVDTKSKRRHRKTSDQKSRSMISTRKLNKCIRVLSASFELFRNSKLKIDVDCSKYKVICRSVKKKSFIRLDLDFITSPLVM